MNITGQSPRGKTLIYTIAVKNASSRKKKISTLLASANLPYVIEAEQRKGVYTITVKRTDDVN